MKRIRNTDIERLRISRNTKTKDDGNDRDKNEDDRKTQR